MNIWILLSKPKDDCHRNDFIAAWQRKPELSEIRTVISDNEWSPFLLSDKECQHILDGNELDFDENYWSLKAVPEGVYNRL